MNLEVGKFYFVQGGSMKHPLSLKFSGYAENGDDVLMELNGQVESWDVGCVLGEDFSRPKDDFVGPSESEFTNWLSTVPPHSQYQCDITTQLIMARALLNRAGLYDVADLLNK